MQSLISYSISYTSDRSPGRNRMDSLAYLRLQMGLEGIGLAGEHTIKQVTRVTSEELPLMLLAHLSERNLIAYFSEFLSFDLRAQLSQRVSYIRFPKIEPVLDVLNSHKIDIDTGHYKTYIFPPYTEADPAVTCLSGHDPKVQSFGFDGFAEQVYVIENKGRIISACVSVREDKNCGEAWVYTDPAYRRRGLAKKAAGAWARSLISIGKVPFYSHKIENLPSARLAAALQLQPVFEEISITQASSR
ncbi:MAG TPA: GNAT family N-acetyltransferase [Anaerolineales bacterium]|nr:GNAT family N-acetyltransferase [Anaerolineales bacterium]